MDGTQWLAAVAERVRRNIPDVEISTPDEDLATMMLGRRGVVLHVVGQRVMMAPSVSRGTTIADRIDSRVEHSDALAYSLSDSTLDEAASDVAKHLREATFSAS